MRPRVPARILIQIYLCLSEAQGMSTVYVISVENLQSQLSHTHTNSYGDTYNRIPLYKSTIAQTQHLHVRVAKRLPTVKALRTPLKGAPTHRCCRLMLLAGIIAFR